jgi:transposase-like protein
MRSQVEQHSEAAEKPVRTIRRATRRQYSAEDKVRIVIAGLRGEDSIVELCRKEGIIQNLYYRWSKDFLAAGKKRLAGDTAREATSDDVKGLRAEAQQLKELLVEVLLENRLLKKAYSPMRSPIHEIPRCREAGDHPAGRAVVALGAAHPSPAGHRASTFYRWYEGYLARRRGPGRCQSAPRRVWNKLPPTVAAAVVELALQQPVLSPRELATAFVDHQQYLFPKPRSIGC